MKKKAHNIIKKYLYILATFIFGIPALNSQTVHEISVLNNKFSPKELTVNAGDTVRWTNNSGNHNVNGTTGTYPKNPVSFGNDVGTNWTFSFIFEDPGTYDYQCDPHVNLGMKGKIVVEGTTGIDNLNTKKINVDMYPLPFSDKLTISLSDNSFNNQKEIYLFVFDILGNEKLKMETSQINNITINTTEWESSVYIYRLQGEKEIYKTGRMIKF